ncbi:Aste57867_2476 [Aphanomyces stellatus]|uniref:Aste57867_2476 protein n=1 Tax=Aphanomyces stellatus TaxID=120398 RepID=A0A485K7M3_9STRA|nr:hypothetical protein As57867_002470 [Aphanomyces stellatus]VFT79675.1 Aste57867_2476 [Aphanomyces stellatus]
MNAAFHDDAMLDDAMLVDALTAIEYMNGISKESISVGGTDAADRLLKHESSHPADVFLATDSPLAAPALLDLKPVLPDLTSDLVSAAAATLDTKQSVPTVGLLSSSVGTAAPTTAAPTAAAATKASTKQHETKASDPSKDKSPYMQIVVTKEGGLLGFGVLPVKGVCGIQVSTLQPDSSAAKAGLRVGDVLLKLDTTDVSNMHMPAIIQILQAVSPGKPLHISLFRPSVAVPMTTPLVQKGSAAAMRSAAAATTDHHNHAHPPPAKKAKSSSSLPSGADALLAKQVAALTKELQAATAEKDKLSEKNATLRKKVQQMVIASDEQLVKLKAECDDKVTKAAAEKAALQTTVATLQATTRLENRAVFDTTVTTDLKSAVESLQRQVLKYEETEKRRKETRKAHLQMELKLAGMEHDMWQHTVAHRGRDFL